MRTQKVNEAWKRILIELTARISITKCFARDLYPSDFYLIWHVFICNCFAMKPINYIVLILALMIVGFANAQQSESLRKKEYNLEGSLAIQGYDPVAYFKQNKAIEGSKKIQATFKGVTYYFSNEKNKELFLAKPSSYEPQYGGWCAYAMGDDGDKVKIDPETFKIVDGKLYLFYNFFFTNTLTKWNEDEARLKKRADEYWKKHEM